MEKVNWKTWCWIGAAAVAGALMLGGALGGCAYVGQQMLLQPPNLPAVAPFKEEEKIEWRYRYNASDKDPYTVELDSGIRFDGRLYYALPLYRNAIAGTTGKAVAYSDGGMTGWEAALFRESLYRVKYDPNGDFLYQPSFRDGTMYATREAVERVSASRQTLTGLYIDYEADVQIEDPAAIEVLRQLEAVQGETVRYKREGSAAYSYSISYMYNDLPLLHREATIARIDGRLVYVKHHGSKGPAAAVSSPDSSALDVLPPDVYEGVVIEDPQAILDIRVDGKPVFSLKGRQGTAF